MHKEMTMNRLTILVVALLCANNMNAQIKTLPQGGNHRSVSTQIEIPISKKVKRKAASRSTNFVPRSIVYLESEKNGLKVNARGLDQLPIWISGTPQLILRSGDSSVEKGLNFLANAQSLMSIDDAATEFTVIADNKDALGMTHVKYQQVYLGVPIYGAEVIYHEGGKEPFVNGRYVSTPSIESVVPTLSDTEAVDLSVADVGGVTLAASDPFGLFDMEMTDATLVIYEGQLCYQVIVYHTIIDRWEYIIDAHSGDIVSKHEAMCKLHNHTPGAACTHGDHELVSEKVDNSNLLVANTPPDGPTVSNAQDLFGTNRQINTYESAGRFYMIDASRTMYDNINSSIPNDPVGAVWTIDAFNTNPQNSDFEYDHVSSTSSSFSGKQTGVSAQYNGGQAYQYFKTVHDRESINGQGGNVIGLINISDEDGSSLGNAFWNGIAMFYGNGDNTFNPLARGLDVAGHEMSHGVVQSTANLTYQGESGALNESFADIFGAMIDRDDWLIGEDVVKTSAFPSGALRSLQDPHNGASTGNFNAGWQPRTYSERFTGSQDNGGVHINSGIPNWAFFKFATANGVGKNRAEKVYYRALEMYMTKSSQFVDQRIAVIQAATDLYGSAVAASAAAAFDAVEVFGGGGTVIQSDVGVNPGADLILFTTTDQQDLYIADAAGNLIFNPLTTQDPISVPSITDDGSEIIFVNQDKELYYIRLDWNNNQIVEEGVIGSNEQWRNAIFSKDGLRLAALRDLQEDQVYVYDFIEQEGRDFELFNPTFTAGVSTGDVLYADALEFDFTGDYLMYDAFNRIQSSFGNDITYWDIGFIDVFNSAAGTFRTGEDIEKLFSQLPEGVSIGNPTFSKNSDYIIAFDFLQDGGFKVLGANIELGNTGTIFDDHDRPGYPSYSLDDDRVIFDAQTNTNQDIIAAAQLQSDKIQSTSAAVQLGFDSAGIKWGRWFGNGDRELTGVEEAALPVGSMVLAPNPVADVLQVTVSDEVVSPTQVSIADVSGRTLIHQKVSTQHRTVAVDVSTLEAGVYIVTLMTGNGTTSEMFVKQ